MVCAGNDNALNNSFKPSSHVVQTECSAKLDVPAAFGFLWTVHGPASDGQYIVN